MRYQSPKPRTWDADHWATTHDRDGNLNAEGFLRGFGEECHWAGFSMRLYLTDIQFGGPLRKTTYTLSCRDYSADSAWTESFQDLKSARKRWRELHAAFT